MPARAQDAGYSVAVSLAGATYPGQELSGLCVFNSLDVTSGPVRVWASVPLVRYTTTLEPVDPATNVSGAAKQTSTGMADPLFRVDVRLVNDSARALQVGVAASLKPSLVDPAGGLGTGEIDYGFGGSMFKGFGRTSVFADVLYWKYGDPDGVVFEDAAAYSVGVGRVIGAGRWSSMVSVSGFSRGSSGAAAPVQLTVAVLALAGGRQSVALTASIGLTDSASDFSLATSWRTSFGQSAGARAASRVPAPGR